MVRSVEELVAVDDPQWPHVLEWIASASVRVDVLPVERAAGERVLHRLQVTARSTLGALALHSGGLVLEDGWLVLLGGGHEPLPDLARASGLGDIAPDGREARPAPGLMWVAWDAVGGRFAVNGGALEAAAGEVCYLAPDTLAWEGTGLGHTDLVAAMLGPVQADFYADLRWEGWREDVAALDLGRAFTHHPPLCTAEGRDPRVVTRRAVPREELHELLDDIARQVGPPTSRG